MLSLINIAAKGLRRVLEWIVLFLMIALTVVVLVAVMYRLANNSLSWYDEVAAIQLARITYYGAALAALNRNHIGFDSVLLAIPMPYRMGAVITAEVIVIWFFFILAQTGFQVLEVLEGDTLVALTWVPVQFTQSVIPIGAILFILCELLSLPTYWVQIARGISLEHRYDDEPAEG